MKTMNIPPKWRLALLKSIQLQLFISLISLPFLVAWGLPISLVSLFSTLLFTPFLTIFLFLSSIIFFLELLTIPNTWLIIPLEWITNIWIFCLKTGSSSWLVGFSQPSFIFLLCIPACALALMHCTYITSHEQRIISLSAFLLITCALLKLFPYRYKTIDTIACNNHRDALTLINHHNTRILIDPGFIAARPSFESTISYTIIPELIKKTGNTTIDHLVVYKINKRVFDALTFLATKITIKNLYLPWWTGKIPPFAWQSYVALKKTLMVSGGKIQPISRTRYFYRADDNAQLFIEPHQTKQLRYYTTNYPSLCVHGHIDDEIISI